MVLTSVQKAELDALKEDQNITLRATVGALENVLYEPIKLLDHGFIRVVDYMGDDNAIVQAARVSYGKGTKKVNQDAGLIKYLLRNYHTTPFEMCEIKFHIKMPVFVARQWIRHRTANVNEYSARYSVLDKEFYIPDVANIAAQSKQNHQGRSDQELSPQESQRVLEILKEDADRCYRNYEILMNEDINGNIIDEQNQGIARELARMNLPINVYTQWYWKIDLHNLLHFLLLRADSHAQYEIRVYAQAMLDIIKKWVPITWEAFEDYRMNAVSLSGKGLEVIKKLLKGKTANFEDSGMSKREWDELVRKFDLEM